MTLNSQDSFEFSSSFEAEFCIADDVIHNGKLLPFKSHPHDPYIRRCESEGGGISCSKRSRNHTAEYHKLRRAASEPNGVPKRAPPLNPSKTKVKPRWYWFAFWSTARPSAEMEMRDIKSRVNNSRRRSLTESNGAWRVVRSLSCNCKGAESTAVVSVSAS